MLPTWIKILVACLGAIALVTIGYHLGPSSPTTTERPAVAPSATAERPAATLPATTERPPETQQAESLPQFGQRPAPTPPDPERQKLIAERDYEGQQLALQESMLAAPSFAVRTDLFCRDAADAYLANGLHGFSSDPPIATSQEAQMEMDRRFAEARDVDLQFRRNFVRSIKHGPYGLTLDDLKTTYTQLMKEQPSTREAEVLRDQKLSAIREGIGGYAKELSGCRTAVVYGQPGLFGRRAPPVPLPTDDELREKCRRGRERIAQIERELAPH